MVKKFIQRGYIWLVIAFLYAPILLLAVYSFNNSQVVGQWSSEWSFALYKQLFTSEELMTTVANTLILAFVSSILSTILGTMGAIGMFYSRRRVRNTMNTVTQIPVINAEIVTAISTALICTMFAFGRTYVSLLIGHVILTFPFVVLNVTPKLKQMDKNLYEAALDLGATPTQALFKVIIPQVLPGIFSGFLIAITLSLDDYIITTFTKPATFNTISTFVFDAYAKGGRSADVPALRALSTIIFLVIVLMLIVKNLLASKGEKTGGKK
jgi:spermidine/putrescine transport system permease protein